MDSALVRTTHASYWIEDGILHIEYNQNLVISLEVAKTMVEERHDYIKGACMPILVDIRGLASVDTASRKYFASTRSIENVLAGALLADSLISKLAGNIYITVDKPPIPLRLFTDKEKAKRWLKKYII